MFILTNSLNAETGASTKWTTCRYMSCLLLASELRIQQRESEEKEDARFVRFSKIE